MLNIEQYEIIGLTRRRALSDDDPQEAADTNQHEVSESPIVVNNNDK